MSLSDVRGGQLPASPSLRSSIPPPGAPGPADQRRFRLLSVSPLAVGATTLLFIAAYTLGTVGAPLVLGPFVQDIGLRLRPVLGFGVLLMTVPFVLFSARFLFPTISDRLMAACGGLGLCLLGFLWGLWVSGPDAVAHRGLYVQGIFTNFTQMMMLSQFVIAVLSSLALVLVSSPAMQRTRLSMAILASSVLGSAVYSYLYVSMSI